MRISDWSSDGCSSDLIKKGQRVAQGTVIGRVGSTGLATGPHLHYEFRVNGVHRNPLAVTMPPPEPLKGAQLAEFRAQTGPALARLRQFEDIIYAERSEEHTSELQSLMRITSADFCLKK